MHFGLHLKAIPDLRVYPEQHHNFSESIWTLKPHLKCINVIALGEI